MREEILLSLFDRTGLGLEVGPSYNPLAPKSRGFNVETLDYTDKAGLIKKYENDPTVDTSRIEEVDFVSDGRPMLEVIGQEQRYDYIIASHVIEHTPNMLGFMNECDRLLKPNGSLVLAIPDKRYCFDILRPLSSTGEILDAFVEERTRHTPGKSFDLAANLCDRNGASGWYHGAPGDLALRYDLGYAKGLFENAKITSDYLDTHAWTYTPSSFRLILRDLNEMNLLNLREDKFHDTYGLEFFVALPRNGTGCAISRLELACAVNDELAVIGAPKTQAIVDEAVFAEQKAVIEMQNAEIARLRDALQSAESELLSISRSRSWRLTSPLRALNAKLRVWHQGTSNNSGSTPF
jgi:SAM-dependent methyltransferase